jgi:hypothetical protein
LQYAASKRPSCRAAEQRDELTPSYSMELHLTPVSPGQDCRIPILRQSAGTLAGVRNLDNSAADRSVG